MEQLLNVNVASLEHNESDEIHLVTTTVVIYTTKCAGLTQNIRATVVELFSPVEIKRCQTIDVQLLHDWSWS